MFQCAFVGTPGTTSRRWPSEAISKRASEQRRWSSARAADSEGPSVRSPTGTAEVAGQYVVEVIAVVQLDDGIVLDLLVIAGPGSRYRCRRSGEALVRAGQGRARRVAFGMSGTADAAFTCFPEVDRERCGGKRRDVQ
jgi:hypothetical protein